MSNQIVISSGAKVRSLNGVITGTTGVLDSLPINASNGIPQLDVNGKILVSQLPNSVMEYQGTWNANTNTPTLTNGGAFNQGDVYLCNVAGTTDFGAGPIAFVVGDQVIYSGSIWQRASGSTGTVTSVAVTESGDALTITGSPITTSGTINIGFAGTSAQYVAGNGALVTFPDLTGYVTLTTSQTISGAKTFTANNLFTTYPNRFNEGVAIKETASYGTISGYTIIAGAASGLSLYLANGGIKTFAFANATTNNTYTFPNASGTVALTSDLTGGTVTSVGLTMPSAFNVASSPITTSGTLAVTGAGFASQYIRGDGTLADFPSSGGGGSSVSYYLNGGTSQGVIGGITYYEMSKTADTGTGVDFPKTGDGLIVSFLTDANDPAQLNIPSGNWNYEIYVSMSANGGTPQLYAELYKYDGTTFTLISTSSNEIIYDGTTLNMYTFAMAVPTTTLTVTDRLAVKLYAANSGGKTTTVHTQNGHLCQVITTFSTGISALNGLTAQVQYFQVGTSGTDFNISSSTATHTFNLPTASAANRGALSSADWTIFNNKQSTLSLTTTGNSGSATLVSNTLNVPTYTLAGLGGISLTSLSATSPLSYNNTTGAFSIQVANTSQDGYLSSTDWNTFNSKQSTITNPVTGTGTSGQVTYFNGTSSVTGSSNFKFDGTNLTIGNPSSALAQLHVYNASAAASFLLQTNSTTDYSEIAVRNNSSTATSYFRQYSTAATGSDFGISRAGLALFFSNYATNFAIGTRNGGDLILGTADTERARILASNGNFGINESNPTYKLDVNGTGRFSSSSTNQLTLNGGTTVATRLLVARGSDDSSQNLLLGWNSITVQRTSVTITDPQTDFSIIQQASNGSRTALYIASTGAATFSSSVTANSLLTINEAYGGEFIRLQRSGVATQYASLRYGIGGAYGLVFDAIDASASDPSFIWRTSTNGSSFSERMRITSGGNVGIGTTSPTQQLSLGMLAISATRTYVIDNQGTLSFYNLTTGNLEAYLDIASVRSGNDSTLGGSNIRFITQSTSSTISGCERMRITSGGNVGIGTTSPSTLLHLNASNTAYRGQLTIQSSDFSQITFYKGATTQTDLVAQIYTYASDNSLNINNFTSTGYIAFGTNAATERMRITSGGNVGIGTSSAGSPLEVVATGGGTCAIQGRNPNGTTAPIFQASSITTGSTSWYAYVAQSGNGSAVTTNTMFVYGNGNIVNVNNSYGTLSDIKLKENIVDATPKLDDILKLKVRNFNLIGNGTKQIGFIAQEMEKIFPALIEETPDKDLDNNDLGTVTKTIKTSVLIPMLVKAIQEQQKQIEELKAKIK